MSPVVAQADMLNASPYVRFQGAG